MICFQIFEWTAEVAPPIPARCRYNNERHIIDSYYTNQNQTINTTNSLPLVLTGVVCQTLDCLRTWLRPKHEQHFLLIGRHGSGKT